MQGNVPGAFEEADLIGWNIIRDNVRPRYELYLRNLTVDEVAIVAQTIAAMQRRREHGQQAAIASDRLERKP